MAFSTSSIAAIKGDTGTNGSDGAAGAAAGFGTPTVTTGSAGSSCTISSSGPDTAKIFAFTIPRGDTGATGSIDLTADQAWTGSQRATPVAANTGTFDLDGAQNFTCTPTGTFALNFTGDSSAALSSTQAGQSGFIKLVNGGHTMTLNALCKSDTTATTGFIDTISTKTGTFLVSYLCDGTNVYLSTTKALA